MSLLLVANLDLEMVPMPLFEQATVVFVVSMSACTSSVVTRFPMFCSPGKLAG